MLSTYVRSYLQKSLPTRWIYPLWTWPLIDACWTSVATCILSDMWRLFFQDQSTLLQYWGQSLSLCAATCQMVGCFAYGLIAQAIVTQSQSNAYSAQKQECVVRIPGWMLGHVQVISILMKRERPVIYFRGNTGKMLKLGAFPFSLHLDFLFELNEVCM